MKSRKIVGALVLLLVGGATLLVILNRPETRPPPIAQVPPSPPRANEVKSPPLPATETGRPAPKQVPANETAVAERRPPAENAPAPAAPDAQTLAFEKQIKENRVRVTGNMYRLLFQELNWDSATQEKFLEIQVSKLEKGDRMLKKLLPQGGELDPLTSEVMFDQINKEMNAELAATFGPATLEKIKEFDEVRPARPIVQQLQSRLAEAGVVLTPEQRSELVRIIAGNSKDSAGRVDLRIADIARISAASGRFLNASQIESLKEIIAARTNTGPVSLKN